MFLVRKGFGTSGQAARRRPKGFFDGWPEALRRYNARRDRTADGRFYSEAYAEKIRRRADHPTRFEPIEIRFAAANKKSKTPSSRLQSMGEWLEKNPAFWLWPF